VTYTVRIPDDLDQELEEKLKSDVEFSTKAEIVRKSIKEFLAEDEQRPRDEVLNELLSELKEMS
jgi:Arc/MetJ-type ribon-helix-helix transcriptional regulator